MNAHNYSRQIIREELPEASRLALVPPDAQRRRAGELCARADARNSAPCFLVFSWRARHSNALGFRTPMINNRENLIGWRYSGYLPLQRTNVRNRCQPWGASP